MNATADTLDTLTLQPGVVAQLPLDAVDLDPDQPRKDIDADYIAELAADIKRRGVMQPITVRANPDWPGRYVIKYGECRFRASLEAAAGTIPALLDADDQGDDRLGRLLDQVKENHIRRDLNPMEWAAVLRRMRDDHQVKSIAAIEETLKSHGITNMGRSYISNLMRLAELPEWAQDLIRAGELTAAHGKYLLPATSSEDVLEEMREGLVDDGWRPSVREMQVRTFTRFQVHHHSLGATWTTPFDYKTECNGCQKKQQVSTEHDKATFCLDGACHQKKTKAYYDDQRAQQLAGRPGSTTGADDDEDEYVPPKVSEDGTVDLDNNQPEGVDWRPLLTASFEVAGCEGCEHQHQAVWTSMGEVGNDTPGCFNLTCFYDKTEAARKELHKRQIATNAIERWLRRALVEPVRNNADAQLALIGAAVLEPALVGFDYDIEDIIEEAAEAAGIRNIADLLRDGLLHHGETLATKLLEAAEAPVLVPLAQHLAIVINDWEPDADWLGTRPKAELVDGLIQGGAYDDSDRARLSALNTDELIERCLDHPLELPVPGDITSAWAQLLEAQQRYNDGERE